MSRAVVDAKEFSHAMSKISKILKKCAIPILEEVCLQIQNGRCTLTATDLETWLTAELPASGDDMFFVFRKTKDILRACSHFAGELTMEFSETRSGSKKAGKILLRCERRGAEFEVYDGADYPNMPQAPEGDAFSVSSARLSACVERVRYSIAAYAENPAGADSTGGKRACSKSAAKAGQFPAHACIGYAKSRPACDTERFTADSARTAKQSGSFPHRPLCPAAERSAAENRLLCGSKHQGTGRYERQQHACYAPSAGRQADPGLRPRRTARTERRHRSEQCKDHHASAGYRGILCAGIL